MKKFLAINCLILVFLLGQVTAGFCIRPTMSNEEGGCGGSSYTPEQLAFQHLYERMDAYYTTGMRLIEGESGRYPDGQQYTAWVYDNSLAIIALVSRGWPTDIARARLLCETLIWVQDNDFYENPDFQGFVRDAYWATGIGSPGNAAIKAPNISTGNMAWVIIAWMYYYNHAADPDQAFRTELLNAAKDLGDFVEAELWSQTGIAGYHIGFQEWIPSAIDTDIKSTEQNADLYVAFKKLYAATNESKWNTRMLQAQSFVNAMYNSAESRYYVGTTATPGQINYDGNQQALDANTMPILALDTAQPLNWLENNCHLTHHGFEGFDFNPDKDGVWFEGTAQMAVAYKKVGRLNDHRKYLYILRSVQATAPNRNGKGLVAACHDWVTTGFSWAYFNALNIAPTSWFIFVERGINPFD